MAEQQQATTYPPAQWKCPECFKRHSKPHFAFEGQIDYSKKPLEPGRVKFDREGDCGYSKSSERLTTTGQSHDEEGLNRPLFCPHCGFELSIIHIVKNPPAGKKKVRKK